MNIEYRTADISDAEELVKIYAPYVLNTAITYEYDVPSISEFKKRIENTLKGYPYLVAVYDSKIVGYAYAGRFHTREAYKYSAELSVYISMDMRGKGIGFELYNRLEKKLKEMGIKNLYACVAYIENEDEYLNHDSVRFHEKFGFNTVGRLNKCGYKFGRWYDMLYMEKFIGEHT